jgi:inosine/xanthosine triphosphatase
MGDDETRRGAWNRADAALKTDSAADFSIGIEGGCALDADGAMRVFAWVVVIARDGKAGQSKTGTFYLPQEVARLVQDGLELGDADDRVFGRTNSKQQSGSIGLLTDNVIDREAYYVHAVVMALIPFKNPQFTFPAPNFSSSE